MSSLIPPPVRAAAGLAAWTLDEARRLPTRLVSLPVVAAGAAMQASLRLQQEYAGLVARGDELIVRFRGGSDDPPAWATFDEEPAPMPAPGPPTAQPGYRRGAVGPLLSPPGVEPSSFDLIEEAVEETDTAAALEDLLATEAVLPEPPVAGYDGWTLAQLRARLRRLSPDELALLLAYEEAGRHRRPYVTMLGNKLAAQSKV